MNKNAGSLRMQHQRSTGNMPGSILNARKRGGRILEKTERQIPALRGQPIGARIKTLYGGNGFKDDGVGNSHCRGVFSSSLFAHARSGSIWSDLVNASRALAFW